MAFSLSLMAIYYALKNKIGLSLAFWACAVGCRPFQILYLPALLYLIYNAHKAVNPEDKIIDIIKKRYLALVPMAVIALSYMILNFARFGNITGIRSQLSARIYTFGTRSIQYRIYG